MVFFCARRREEDDRGGAHQRKKQGRQGRTGWEVRITRTWIKGKLRQEEENRKWREGTRGGK